MLHPSAIMADPLPKAEGGVFDRNRSDGDIDPARSSPTSLDTNIHNIGCSSTVQQQQATEIVKALFGNDSIGKVVGVYSCSVARQSGRLYVSTDGLFFYSNLFGFEKRICIKYDDAVEILKYRHTSLYVRTFSGDEHVFKSFQDRDSVCKMISRFCTNTQVDLTTSQSLLFACKKAESRDSFESEKRNDSIQANESILSEPRSSLEPTVEDSIRSSDSETEISGTLPSIPNKSMSSIWEAIKRQSNDWEPSIANMKLPLNKVSDFFDLFLCDEAPHSLSSFHQVVMRDTNVSLSTWTRDDTTESAENSDESLSRIIQFEHKSKVSVARVTRNQTYRSYGECACMKNVTRIKGVPSADTFFVEDMWTIEKCEDAGIILNVKYRITFLKSTFLKSMIESRIRSETLEWYDRYASFLREAMPAKSQSGIRDEIQPLHVLRDNSYTGTLKPGTQLLLLLCLFIIAFFVYSLKIRVMELENVLAEMESRILSLENQCLLGL
eukprot:CCRYP_014538-RC/>CCRYP_014538-RC protein AED:0.09 eAED:0.09 QI:153/1/1/1/1/1/6/63/495